MIQGIGPKADDELGYNTRDGYLTAALAAAIKDCMYISSFTDLQRGVDMRRRVESRNCLFLIVMVVKVSDLDICIFAILDGVVYMM